MLYHNKSQYTKTYHNISEYIAIIRSQCISIYHNLTKSSSKNPHQKAPHLPFFSIVVSVKHGEMLSTLGRPKPLPPVTGTGVTCGSALLAWLWARCWPLWSCNAGAWRMETADARQRVMKGYFRG